jgi:hypothetical protein
VRLSAFIQNERTALLTEFPSKIPAWPAPAMQLATRSCLPHAPGRRAPPGQS